MNLYLPWTTIDVKNVFYAFYSCHVFTFFDVFYFVNVFYFKKSSLKIPPRSTFETTVTN